MEEYGAWLTVWLIEWLRQPHVILVPELKLGCGLLGGSECPMADSGCGFKILLKPLLFF